MINNLNIFLRITNIELKKLKGLMFISFVDIFSVLFGVVISFVLISLFIKNGADTILKKDPYHIYLYVISAVILDYILFIGRIPQYASSIKSGAIARYWLYPVDLFYHVWFQELGATIIRLIRMIPIIITILLLSILFNIITPFSLLAVFPMIGAIIIADLMTISFYAISFRTVNTVAPKAIFSCINSILSGLLVPLSLWPETTSKIIRWTPFALTLDGPIRVLTDPSAFMWVVIAQAIWILLIWFFGSRYLKWESSHCPFLGG